MSDTAKIVQRGTGWAIEVEINGKAGFVGKAFDGVTIYPTFDAAQREAEARGYLVVNKQPGMLRITDLDERGGTLFLEADNAAGILALAGVPLIGVIEPKTDLKYGHTFTMPAMPAELARRNGNGKKGR